jgi:hypothetical protein
MSKSAVSVVNVPAMSTPEFYNQLIQTIKQSAPLQPRDKCQVVRVVTFLANDSSVLSASNKLNVPFPVTRVRYSIVAKQTDNANDSPAIFIISSSLTGDNIGAISNTHADYTQGSVNEFIYPSPRMFSNEGLTLQIMEGYADRLAPVNFFGTITLILELSNY